MTHNHNSPQPTEQPEVLYRLVKASERVPGNKNDFPLMFNGSYYIGWYSQAKNRWFTDSNEEFFSEDVEWLEPLPSPQPGESVDALAKKANGYGVYAKGSEKHNAFNEGFAEGYKQALASHSSPSVDAEPSPQEAVQDLENVFINNLLAEFNRQGINTENWDGDEGWEKAIVDGVKRLVDEKTSCSICEDPVSHIVCRSCELRETLPTEEY